MKKKLLTALKKAKKEVKNDKFRYLLLILLFSFFVFLRFYDLENKSTFTWDQVDNAWAAKTIIDDGRLPLVGMQVRGATGFYIGPLYYYFITPFYYLTNLDPVAAGIIAGITAIFSFIIFAVIIRKLFSFNTALVSLFFLTFSWNLISIDRVQWPVNLIPPISLIIFFSPYKIIKGKEKYIILLSIATGVMFHIHFTAVLFPILILFCLPFFPRNRETLKYSLISILIFILFLVPSIANSILSQGSTERSMLAYLNNFYHGFHLKRFMQITGDALIEFNSISYFGYLKYLSWLVYPLFASVLWIKNKKRERIIVLLGAIWILVPWIVFSTYSGELTNYYFKMTMPIALMSISYLVTKVFESKKIILIMPLAIFLFYYAFAGLSKFVTVNHQGLKFYRERTMEKIDRGERIEFQMGVPDSYIYYIEVERKENVK